MILSVELIFFTSRPPIHPSFFQSFIQQTFVECLLQVCFQIVPSLGKSRENDLVNKIIIYIIYGYLIILFNSILVMT